MIESMSPIKIKKNIEYLFIYKTEIKASPAPQSLRRLASDFKARMDRNLQKKRAPQSSYAGGTPSCP